MQKYWPYLLSPLGCDRRQQWRLCLEPRNAHECNEFNEFESSLRCAPDWNSHWLRPNVAPQAPWRGAQARRHLWRQQVWCSTSYSYIFLPRQLHRRLKQQTLPGTHLPPFIEDFTAFEAACQLWPTFHILVAVSGKLVGKSPFAFCWLGPEAGISKAAAAAPNQARKI